MIKMPRDFKFRGAFYIIPVDWEADGLTQGF